EPQAKLDRSTKILVIAMMTDKDKKLRQSVEDAMVENLQANGIQAGSSLSIFGPNAFDKLNDSTMISKIKTEGYEGAFTIALVSKTKQKNYRAPGFVSMYNPYRFWGYYNYWGFHNNMLG
ncbi:TPA: hypothetical protein R1S30_005126, partial [Escherichia coli]|nr:hypothetical protein [Escherichia coli]